MATNSRVVRRLPRQSNCAVHRDHDSFVVVKDGAFTKKGNNCVLEELSKLLNNLHRLHM